MISAGRRAARGFGGGDAGDAAADDHQAHGCVDRRGGHGRRGGFDRLEALGFRAADRAGVGRFRPFVNIVTEQATPARRRKA